MAQLLHLPGFSAAGASTEEESATRSGDSVFSGAEAETASAAARGEGMETGALTGALLAASKPAALAHLEHMLLLAALLRGGGAKAPL